MEDLAIGEVARRAGIRPSALRYYESIHLLPAPRRVGGRRRYGENTIQMLKVIQLAQQAGFTVAEIQTLLHGFAPDTPTWGRLVTDGINFLQIASWLPLVPGALIFLTVLSINFMGDGLRDALDPRSRL